MDRSVNKTAKINIISSMFIFGTIGIFVRYIPLSSSIIAFVRGIMGALFLLIYVKLRGIKLSWSNIKSNLLLLCLTGAFIGINWILLFESYRFTTVATATMCYYFAPVFVILVSPFVFKEKITLTKGLCVTMALLGMVLISGILDNGLTGSRNFIGILLGVGAALFYASIIVLNKKLKDISAYDQTIIQLSIAGIVLIPYILMTENIMSITLSPRTIILLVVVGIIHTGISYAMYFGSMKSLKAQTIAIFSYIDPVVAIILSAIILKEKMNYASIIGAVLILGSTLVSEIKDTNDNMNG